MSKKAWIKLVVIAVAVILSIILILRNADKRAEFDFIFFTREAHQIIMMLIIFALGFVTGIFTALKVMSEQKKKKA